MTSLIYRKGWSLLDDLELGRRIVHFEIPASDTEKISKFYGGLFGWKFSKSPMVEMEYWLIETTGKSLTDLGGGMYKKVGENDKPRFYVNVDDIDEHTNRFRQAGGTALVEKQTIPGMGYSVLGADPEGNIVGMFQPLQASSPGRTARKASGSRAKKSKSAGKKRGK
jgi:predicted enzyme related to lactoylglutathione lyase